MILRLWANRARAVAVSLAWLACALPAQAAVTVDSRDAAPQRCTVTAVACAHSFTNTAGAAVCFGIVVTETTGSGGVAVTAATYNSISLTDIGVSQSWSTSSNLATIYCLVSPATGANSASVTATGHGSFAVLFGAVSFAGNETSSVANMIGLTGTGTGSGTHAVTGSIAAASTSFIFGAGGQGSGDTMAPDSGWTETFEKVGTAGTAGDNLEAVDKAGTGAGQAAGFTWSTSDNWGIVACEIKAAAAGGAATPTRALLGLGTD